MNNTGNDNDDDDDINDGIWRRQEKTGLETSFKHGKAERKYY